MLNVASQTMSILSQVDSKALADAQPLVQEFFNTRVVFFVIYPCEDATKHTLNPSICLERVTCSELLYFTFVFVFLVQKIEQKLTATVNTLELPISDSRTCYVPYQQFRLSSQKSALLLERLQLTKETLQQALAVDASQQMVIDE